MTSPGPDADAAGDGAPIATEARPCCLACGTPGVERYRGLADRLFDVPGRWSVRQCASTDCGLLWLDPMPAPADTHRLYRSYYTHAAARPAAGAGARLLAMAKRGYLANHFGYAGAGTAARLLGLLPWLYPGRRPELDFSVMWLHARGRGRLLDVGAGSGWLVEHMNSLGWQAEGLDFDAHAVANARRRGLVFSKGGLLDRRFEAASFDAVTLSHCIEHVHDPLAWLVEARRILRPGGRLSLATPNAASLGHRLFGSDWFPLDPPRHLHLFNPAVMGTLMRRAGFTEFRMFTSSRDANGAFIGSRSIRRTGRHDMVQGASRPWQVVGRAAQWVEAIALRGRPGIGEDLVVLAERPT